MACSHTRNCDLYVQFAADPSIKLWKAHYCDNEYKRCARFQLSLQGKAVPITLLPNGKSIEVVMSDQDRGLHALFNAIQKNRLSMVKAFMKTKLSDAKVSNAEGVTPVMYAASLGHTEIVQFLMENGCNPHHRNNKGENAMDIAAAAGHHECAEMLRKAMFRIAPPQEESASSVEADTKTAPRNAMMGRILGFLRGNKPEAV